MPPALHPSLLHIEQNRTNEQEFIVGGARKMLSLQITPSRDSFGGGCLSIPPQQQLRVRELPRGTMRRVAFVVGGYLMA